MHKRIAVFLLLVGTLGVLSAQSQPNVKIIPVKPTSAASGSEMFTRYCAACHGIDGQGNGPAAAALNKAPADLTRLAAGNNHVFDDLKVLQAISGEKSIPAHGTSDMPIWGDILKSLDANRTLAQLRLVNLTTYIKSIQK